MTGGIPMNTRPLARTLAKTAATALLVALCLASAAHAASKKIPSLYMGYIFTTHHTPLMVAADRGDAFKECGAYLAPMVPKQKYKLMAADGTPLAVINFIVSKNGSETSTLFAMNRLDLGLASSTAFMSGIDKGTKVKMLCPLHVDGLSMVFPKGSTISGYDEVAAAIKASKVPFKIGYHSPTSAPRIVFEGALREAGFTTTGNPNDIDADILMVDLKSTANLIPALVSGQVDCWVGPAPHPAVAEFRKVGHVALNSRDLPPKGQWTDFPCCALGASDSLIKSHPAVVQAITDLLAASATWCNAEKSETAQISAKWIGVPAKAVEKSSIIYTTDPTENWLKGEDVFLAMLNRMNKFRGVLKGEDLKSATPLLYDFSFVKK